MIINKPTTADFIQFKNGATVIGAVDINGHAGFGTFTAAGLANVGIFFSEITTDIVNGRTGVNAGISFKPASASRYKAVYLGEKSAKDNIVLDLIIGMY